MSHYNQNRNFATHYLGQDGLKKANQQNDSSSVNRNLNSSISASLSVGLSSIREKCMRLLEKQEQNSGNSNNSSQKKLSSDMRMLTHMNAKTLAMKGAVNEGRANILKPQAYRAGIGSESLTAQQRDAQTQAMIEEKKKDILANTAPEDESSKNDNNTSSAAKANKISQNIKETTQDASERKILSRVLPRAVMRGGNNNNNGNNSNNEMMTTANSDDDEKESGKIRQREESDDQQQETKETAQPAVPPQQQQKQQSSKVVNNNMTLKGGAAVVSSKKFAVDPRAALLGLGKKNKRR